MSKQPKNWQVVSLDKLVNYILDYRGKTPKKSKTGIPTLSAKSVKNNYIDYSEVYYISSEEYSNFMRKGLPNVGDVLLTVEAPLGLSTLLDRDDVGLGQRIVTINGKNNVLENRYLKFYLQSPYGQHELQSRATGTTVTGISQKNLRKINIILPSYEEQEMIANLLSSFDDKIENNNAIIVNLEEQAQAIFKSWFVDFEPFQDGEFVESDLGDIPKGWSIESLGDIVNIYDSERKPLSQMVRQGMERNYPYYGANGVIDYVEDYLFDGKYLLLGEDGTVQTNEGYPILNYIEEKFWVSNHAHIMTGDKISTEFLYVSIKRRNIRDIITGAVQQKINQRNLKSIKLVIPESNILINFQNIIEPIFEKVLVLKKSNKKLEETRDILLPKLMSGEIRVEEAIEVEEM